MQSSLEKLRKFFRLEHENRYGNTAVIGGLANILNLWEGEARNDGLPEEIIQATGTALRGYSDQTPEARADALKVLWKQIQEKVPAAAAPNKQPPTRPPQQEPEPVLQENIPMPEPPPPVEIGSCKGRACH